MVTKQGVEAQLEAVRLLCFGMTDLSILYTYSDNFSFGWNLLNPLFKNLNLRWNSYLLRKLGMTGPEKAKAAANFIPTSVVSSLFIYRSNLWSLSLFLFLIAFTFMLPVRRGRHCVEVVGSGSLLQGRFTPTLSLPWMRFSNYILHHKSRCDFAK